MFTRESSQQAKQEREIFLGFLFNYYYNMEIELTIFFISFIKHTRRKLEKEIQNRLNQE